MRLMRLFALAATLVLVYGTGLEGPFLFDDYFNFQPVRDWFNGQRYASEVIWGNSSGLLGRPVSMLSFLLSAGVGAHAPLFYKLGNLVLHIGIALLIVNITRRLIDLAKPELPAWWAWLAGALWALHPLHVSTVLYSVQRMAQLSTLFLLLGALCFLLGAAAMQSGRTRAGWLWWLLGVTACWLLGLFSKENALILPALLWSVSLLLPSAPAGANARRLLVPIFWLPLLLGTTLLLWRWPDLVARYARFDFGPWERLLTEGRVLCQYLRLWFWPDISVMGLYWDDTEVSRGLMTPPTTTLAALGLMGLSALAWWLRRHIPLFWVGWLWFVLGHAVESTILPLDLMYEHRNYLPSIGLIWMALSVLAQVAKQESRSAFAQRRTVVALVLIVCGGLAWQTHALASIWQDYDRLMRHGYSGHPESPRARQAYATSLIRQAKYPEARDIVLRGLHASDPRERFLTRLDLLAIDCMAGWPSSIGDEVLFAELPSYVGTGEIVGIDQLLRVTSRLDCSALPRQRVASILQSMLEALPESKFNQYGQRELLRALSSVYVSLGDGNAALDASERAFALGADVPTAGLRLTAAVSAGNWQKAEFALKDMRTLAERSGSLRDEKELAAAERYLAGHRSGSATNPLNQGRSP